MNLKSFKKALTKGKRFEYLYGIIFVIFLMSFNSLPHSTLITINKNAPWVLYYTEDLDRWQGNPNTLVQDFKNQGWQIQTSIECESRSAAKTQWDLFKSQYSTNPALCILSKGQTPIYGTSPSYWAWYVYSSNHAPGTWDESTEQIYGNARGYNENDHALVKFTMDGTRAVVIVWTGARFDTGNLDSFVYSWRWVAIFGNDHKKDWYIFDNHGLIVDSQNVANEETNPDGTNPETNPNLNDPNIGNPDMDEPIPPTNPNDIIGPNDSDEYTDRGLLSMLEFIEIITIMFLVGGIAILFKRNKQLQIWRK